jgi:hypothetical protein
MTEEKKGLSAFTGKPTKKYPKGRVYTVDLIMKKSGIKRQSAIWRIKRALKDPSKESELLKPSQKPRIARHIPTPEELTPKQRETMRQFKDIADGRVSVHQILGD